MGRAPKLHFALIVATSATMGIVACVSDSMLVDSGSPDASPDTSADAVAMDVVDSSSDADATAPACDLMKPFSMSALPPPLNSSANDLWLWLFPDQLNAVTANTQFFDGSTSLQNVFATRRANLDAAFDPLQPMASINGVGGAGGSQSPVLTDDGRTVYFTTGSASNYDTWSASRNSTVDPFSTPTLVPPPINQNGAGEDSAAWISGDGSTLYFMSNRAGSNNRDIYTAVRSNGMFGTPTNLGAVNSAANEDNIALSADELQAFVTRSGKIYYTSRISKMAGFSPPALVPELNSGSSTVSWVSADGCSVYLNSNRDGGFDLYVATRGK